MVKSKFIIVHLNINSVHSKIKEIDELLKLKAIDILALNETKLDSSKPLSFYKNSDYNMVRRDRCYNDSSAASKGGGLIIFIKKKFRMLNEFKSPVYELICLKLEVNN